MAEIADSMLQLFLFGRIRLAASYIVQRLTELLSVLARRKYISTVFPLLVLVANQNLYYE